MTAGYIDEVADSRIWGRCSVDDGEEFEFDMSIFDVLECQRVDLEPGSYIQFVNGHLLVEKTMVLSHEIEIADIEAKRLHRMLNFL